MVKNHLPRRHVLKLGGGIALTAALPFWPVAAAPRTRDFRLSPHPSAKAPLVGGTYPATDVWSYDGTVPGPEIRVKQGDRLKVVVENQLTQDTTIHWHGIRTPFAMDGVPDLTQKPIAPGGRFVYEFDVPDAGTYWYHPHARGVEQVGRGLYGALIVEEPEPVKVDREVTWVLDDWRLTQDAQIDGNFNSGMDMSHGGRLGNTVTVNGRVMESFPVRAGERIRLRLINVANARHFALEFAGHQPKIIALDGQPVTPHEAEDGRIVLGPAMRADLIIDMSGDPGQRFTVTDRFYGRRQFRLLDLAYGKAPPLRANPLDAPMTLAGNTMPEPDLKSAQRHEIGFGGGMMGRMRQGMLDGQRLGIREMMRRGKMWVVNGVAANGHVMDPVLTLKRGASYILAMANDTAWPHPIHLHGHAFRVIARNGKPTQYSEWRDTVLMMPGEKVDIAFVADNPGDWLFHCHVLEHMAGGMMAVIRVT